MEREQYNRGRDLNGKKDEKNNSSVLKWLGWNKEDGWKGLAGSLKIVPGHSEIDERTLKTI